MLYYMTLEAFSADGEITKVMEKRIALLKQINSKWPDATEISSALYGTNSSTIPCQEGAEVLTLTRLTPHSEEVHDRLLLRKETPQEFLRSENLIDFGRGFTEMLP